jgi:hypothetical protein
LKVDARARKSAPVVNNVPLDTKITFPGYSIAQADQIAFVVEGHPPHFSAVIDLD